MPGRRSNAAADMTRKRRRWPYVLAVCLLLIAAGGWILATGSKPLVDGEQLGDGRITLVADGFIAAYLVELNDGVALIDATQDTSATAIRAALTKKGLADHDVRAILLTHGHGDHIGGALAFPDAAVYVLEDDADLVAGRRTADNLLGRFREPEATGIDVHRALNDGERFTLGGVEVEVFGVPGHTRGSAAYLVHGVLFLGDSAGATSEDGIAAAPPVFSWDRDINRESLLALAERLQHRQNDVSELAFGHQGPLRGPEPLMDWYRSNR